jgi:hypothetical protein
VLIEQAQRLADVPGYEAIDAGDTDQLGGKVHIVNQLTLDGSLEELRRLGVTISRDAVTGWNRFDMADGKPWLRIVTAGILPRTATVADLLAYLPTGREFVSAVLSPGPDDTLQVELRGLLSDYDSYRDHQLPLLYAMTAAGECGGTGRLSFGGWTKECFVELFVDVDGAHTTIDDPEQQDIDDDAWQERLGGHETTLAMFRAWQAATPTSSG